MLYRYEVGDWVKYKRSIVTPTYGWQGARHKSVGFVQNVLDKDNLVVSFCSGEAQVLVDEVVKVIPLDRGQHVKLKQDVKEPRFDLTKNCYPAVFIAGLCASSYVLFALSAHRNTLLL